MNSKNSKIQKKTQASTSSSTGTSLMQASKDLINQLNSQNKNGNVSNDQISNSHNNSLEEDAILQKKEEQSWRKLKTMFLDLLGLKYHEEFDDLEFKKEYNNYRHFFVEKNFQAFCQSMFIFVIAFTAYGLITYYVECKSEQQSSVKKSAKLMCVPFNIFLQQLMDNQIWLVIILFSMVTLKKYFKKKLTDRSWYFTQILLLTLAYILMIISDFSLQNLYIQQNLVASMPSLDIPNVQATKQAYDTNSFVNININSQSQQYQELILEEQIRESLSNQQYQQMIQYKQQDQQQQYMAINNNKQAKQNFNYNDNNLGAKGRTIILPDQLNEQESLQQELQFTKQQQVQIQKQQEKQVEEDVNSESNRQQMRTIYVNMIFKFFFPLFIMHSVMENLMVKLMLFIFTLIYFVHQMPHVISNTTNDAYTSILIQNIFLALLFAMGFVFQEYKRQDNFVNEFKQIKQMRQNMKFLLTNVLSMQTEQQNIQYLQDMQKKIEESKKHVEGKFDYINSIKKIFNKN